MALNGLWLAAASFAVLFQELALIRWVPSEVRVLAYFPNLILLSAFLGLGLGCLRAGKKSLLWLWPVSLVAICGAGVLLSGIAFTQQSPTEHLWLLYADLGPNPPVVGDVRPPILLFFILGAASFVAPGQIVAERLDAFRAGGKPLTGYCWDLVGSLAGTIGFAVACFGWTPPLVWFAVVAVAAALFFRRRAVLYAALALAMLLIVGAGAKKHLLWSPYYALDAPDGPVPHSLKITANGSVHQYAFDVGGRYPAGPFLQDVRDGYRIPYRALGHKPGRVLVLGAGTGNDIAVALAEGADRVDAVEIDPGILRIGGDHPDHPYSSVRVHVHNTDARSFLENTREKFDLVVFGTLDSMTRLSALSSVRLDNFVYTEQCLRAARARLSERGGIALYFMVGAPHIYRRLLATVAEAFGAPPRVVQAYHQVFNLVIMAGPAFAVPDAAAQAELARATEGEEPSTDDWPYLYLAARGISAFYLSLIAIIALLAVGGIFLAAPQMRSSAADPQMFLLGVGFLLLETRAVTEMTLVWGVSWLTSAVVFGAILLMALLGTLASAWKPLPWGVNLALLAAFLLLGYFLPTSVLLTPSPLLRLLLSLAFLGPPVFFAATLFAAAFEDRTSSAVAFGWNLLGAVAGGLVEFSSMAVGIKSLHLLALAAYLGVGLLTARRTRAPSPSLPP